jgi:cytochrome c biogenesis protein CcdA
MIKKIIIGLFIFGAVFLNTGSFVMAQNENKTEVIVFVREGCSNCAKEEKFLENNENIKNNFEVTLLDIGETKNKDIWKSVVEKYKLSKVTPITLVGAEVLVGFNEKTTGEKILAHSEDDEDYGLDFYISETASANNDNADYSCSVESAATCSIDSTSNESVMTLPFFGEINIQETSLLTMSAILGFIDGFNPCAMWVLLTFLIILSQIGDKKKMAYLVSLFILAEAIMYFFILNVWYQTWDFIALDRWVTPMVGLLAVAAGIYFLRKWYKSKGDLTCDVTSFEHQQKTTKKIQDVVAKPITIITTLAVLGIACSVGIAQSFTKILELNDLTFLGRQFYIFIYTLFYMADDFLIFGLAIFGFEKFHTVGAKYSKLSTLIGGILMLVLGLLLVLKPEWLMFG